MLEIDDPLQTALLEEKKKHADAKQLLTDIEAEVETLREAIRKEREEHEQTIDKFEAILTKAQGSLKDQHAKVAKTKTQFQKEKKAMEKQEKDKEKKKKK